MSDAALRVEIVTPAPRGSRRGNRITALRWARILRSLGCAVRVRVEHDDGDADLFVLLHALKCRPSLARIRAAHPTRPLCVAITGTDLYACDAPADVDASFHAADLILALHDGVADELPADLRARVRVLHQSCAPPNPMPAPAEDAFELVVVGHLRDVKDPFLAAAATRALPATSRIRLVQIGRALDETSERRARSEERANPRYRWLGELTRRRALEAIARSRGLVLTSRAEGGANVISEAAVCATPILATRIPGTVGLLGDDHPGLFEVGDADALARLMSRLENDAAFRSTLVERSRAIAASFAPLRERERWRAILDELEIRR